LVARNTEKILFDVRENHLLAVIEILSVFGYEKMAKG